MKNYRMVLQYEGTRYQGWQKQESTENTIQGKLEILLSKMLETKVEVQGAGRTDAGVHAYGQIANFHCDTEMTAQEIQDYMNQYLPADIGVIELTQTGDRFHSRLNAKGKIYRYRVLNTKVPHIFDRRYVHQVEKELNIKEMQKAAQFLCGSHDFKAFTSTKKGKKSTERRIDEIKIEKLEDEIQFTFRGNGFLYHMIRIIMGTLLNIGSGEQKAEEIQAILESRDREKAGMLVPSKGLTLMEVLYD